MPVKLDFSKAQVLEPEGEGTYKMAGSDGKVVGVPYSQVEDAKQSGLKFWAHSDLKQYTNDRNADTKPGAYDRLRNSFHKDTDPLAEDGSIGRSVQNTVRKFEGNVGRFLRHPVDSIVSGVVNPPGLVGREEFGNMLAGREPIVSMPSREQVEDGIAGLGAGAVTGKLMGKVAGPTGKALGKGAQKMGEWGAETALRIRATDRAHGATPGRAALDYTTGFSPASVAESGRASMQATQAEAGNMVNNALGDVDLQPTRQIAIDALGRAVEENHPETIRRLEDLTDQVVTDQSTQKPIPQNVSARQAAALNRGIANAKSSWNPATANDSMNAAAGHMHHELGEGIAQQVPGIRPLNQRMQSLIPVIQRATSADLNAGVLQRVVSRIGAHTGALTAAKWGADTFGPIGAAAGLIGPELLFNPDAQMMAARALDAGGKTLQSPMVPRTAQAVPILAAPHWSKDPEWREKMRKKK